EQTTGYDALLFGETRLGGVEDAAVRAEGDDAPESLPPTATATAAAGPQTPPQPSPPAAAAASPAPAAPSRGGLITGIPSAAAGAPASGIRSAAAPTEQLGDHAGDTVSIEQ